MKNGKLPTRQEKIIMKSQGLDPDEWLIVKEFLTELEIVNRNDLLIGRDSKPKTRKIQKQVLKEKVVR